MEQGPGISVSVVTVQPTKGPYFTQSGITRL